MCDRTGGVGPAADTYRTQAESVQMLGALESDKLVSAAVQRNPHAPVSVLVALMTSMKH